MPSPNLLAGTCYVSIDGVSLAIVGEGTYRPSGVKRETLTGQDRVHGYSELAGAGMMSWKGRDGNNVSIAQLNAMTNGTVVFQLANGKVIIGSGMWRVGDPISVNTEDGSFPFDCEGPSVTEN